MHWEDILRIIDVLALPLVLLIVLLGVFWLLAKGRLSSIKLGNLSVKAIDAETERIKQRLQVGTKGKPKNEQQYRLLQEYHAQGLAQSKISFWFSLVFAALGFAIIVLSVLVFVFSVPDSAQTSFFDKAAQPAFAMVAGTIIDAVAALFFVQSNKARQLMTEFFDKLRVDRKLDESLAILNAIHDKTVASRVRAMLALNFADVSITNDIFQQIVAGDAERFMDSVPNKTGKE